MVKFEELFQDADENGFKADRKKRVGGYILGRTLGEGSFAKVRLGTHITTNEKVAVKVIDKKMIAKREYVKKNMRREAVMLQRLSHPNIVELVEVMETENSFYIVTELAEGGDFMKYLTDRNCLDESETRKFMRQIVSSVDHMHRSGVLHRDLKIENLLLDANHDMKIIDFGLSNHFDGENLLTTQCGSPAYAAPEIFGKQAYGSAVDVWSIGINMFAMLTGRLPFLVDPPNNLTRLHSLIMQGCKVPDYFSRSCQDILKRLLDPSERSRISMENIIKHQWLNLGQMPLHPYGVKVRTAPSDLSPIALYYMVNHLSIAENQIVDSVVNSKPNATSGTYFLLCQRLKRGQGLPDGVKFVQTVIEKEPPPNNTRSRSSRPSSSRQQQRASSAQSVRRDQPTHTDMPQTARQRDQSNPRDTMLHQREHSLTRGNMQHQREHSQTRGYTPRHRDTSLPARPTMLASERPHKTELSIHVPCGDIVPNGHGDSMETDIGESNMRIVGSGGSQREEPFTQQRYSINRPGREPITLDRKMAFPDTTPRSQAKESIRHSARLRKLRSKNQQDKTQSLPEQLQQVHKHNGHLADSIAIKNVRFLGNQDHGDGVKTYRGHTTQADTHLSDSRPDKQHDNHESPRPSHLSPLQVHTGEYYTPNTPPSTAVDVTPVSLAGRKYGYIRPRDRPRSRQAAQKERQNFAWSLKTALMGVEDRSTTLPDLSVNPQGEASHDTRPSDRSPPTMTTVLVKDKVHVSNVGYYTIPDQPMSTTFSRGQPKYHSDSSLLHKPNSIFQRKDHKRIPTNARQIYKDFLNRDKVTGLGIISTPR